MMLQTQLLSHTLRSHTATIIAQLKYTTNKKSQNKYLSSLKLAKCMFPTYANKAAGQAPSF